MSDSISAYRHYLWSLFQSYSYIPSELKDECSPKRQLSEGGYHAIISLTLNITLMKHFFSTVDEITLIEAVRRMGSERFKDDLWEEMLSVNEALSYTEVSATVDKGDALVSDDCDNNYKKEDLVLFDSYDYEIMRPSSVKKTVTWDVFSSVLLLRLGKLLCLSINNANVLESQKTSLSSTWVVSEHCSSSGFEESASSGTFFCRSEHEVAPNSFFCCSEKEAVSPEPLQKSFFCRSSCSKPENKALPNYTAPRCVAGITEDIVQPTWSLSLKNNKGGSQNICDFAIRYSALPATLEAKWEKQRTPQQAVSDRNFSCERSFFTLAKKEMEIEKAYFADTGPHQSSPPPRPRHSRLITQTFFCPDTAGAATDQTCVCDVKKINQRVTECERGVVHSVPFKTMPEFSSAQPNVKVYRRYSDCCDLSAHYLRKKSLHRLSPSPVAQQSCGGLQNILASISVNIPKKSILPEKKGLLLCYEDHMASAGVHSDKKRQNAWGGGVSRATDNMREQSRWRTCFAPHVAEEKLNGRPLPPRSLSQRAVFRMGSGHHLRRGPIVPKRRTPS